MRLPLGSGATFRASPTLHKPCILHILLLRSRGASTSHFARPVRRASFVVDHEARKLVCRNPDALAYAEPVPPGHWTITGGTIPVSRDGAIFP